MKILGVVILNYNSFNDTIDLVSSMQNKILVEQFQMIVVDNASPNNMYLYLKPLEK